MTTMKPYMVIDGIPSITDSYLSLLRDGMLEDGSFYTIFYDAPESYFTNAWWMDFIKNRAHLFLIQKDEKTVGITWLTNVGGHRADIHYCIFSPYWGDSDKICTEALKELMAITDINCLIATIPETNKFAVDKPEDYGFEFSAWIPNLCWIDKLGKMVAGHQYYYIREE